MTDYQSLRTAIEQEVERVLSAPSDFRWLSKQIEERTREHLSPTTLMRLWGYSEEWVNPRKVTLNILARFLGYMGYDDFMANRPSPVAVRQGGESSSDLSAGEEAENVDIREFAGKKVACKSHWKMWATGIAVVVAVLLVGGFLYRCQPAQITPIRILSLEQLSNCKQYRIGTRDNVRGALGVTSRRLGNAFVAAEHLRCDTASTFAILRHDDAFYLYSVADRRFFNIGGHETDAPLHGPGSAIDIYMRDSFFVMDWRFKGSPMTLNLNEGNGVIITDWGTLTGMFDDGNQLVIEEVGDFDPTEALAMLEEPNREFEAAVESIDPEARYMIYTEAGKGEERTRFYLRCDGHLTEVLTDSCYFKLHPQERWDYYRVPAFQVCHHATPADTCHTSFTFIGGETDDATLRNTALKVGAYHVDEWHSQVFFLGAGGCYAIRTTAMAVESWMAGCYWAAYDHDACGRLESGYIPDRAYIWHLERKGE